ncbi:hypothetical protein Tco_1039359 [Tanacetum coccineum]
MIRYYTLDEDTYPSFLHDDGTGGCLLFIHCSPCSFLTLFLTYFFVYAYMDLLAFICVANPTKVKVGEREYAIGEAKLMDSIIGRVVPLLPVSPARVDSELEASVDRLFDKGGSADQGDSTAGGGQEAKTEVVTGVRIIADETMVAGKPKRPHKKRQAITDASGSFHPPKKLKGDHETSSGAATGGKSPSVLKELLASSIGNGYSRKGAKRKPKTNKSKHGKERTKSSQSLKSSA